MFAFTQSSNSNSNNSGGSSSSSITNIFVEKLVQLNPQLLRVFANEKEDAINKQIK